jgi:hypothetical protein
MSSLNKNSKMECPKCKGKINDIGDVVVNGFTDDNELDLSVICPECDAEYFTFLKMGDLTPND